MQTIFYKKKRIFFFLFLVFLTIAFFHSSSIPFPPVPSEASKIKNHVIKIAPGPQYEASVFYQLIFGKHYREIWKEEVPIKTLDFQYPFKLTPKEVGGNMQTLSLKVKSQEGRSYVLRTVDKDQSKVLPKFLKGSVLTDLLRDQTSAMFPYGAIVVSHLANTAEILHTHPSLFFIPSHGPASKISKIMAGKLVLMEELPDQSWRSEESLGGCDDFISSEELIDSIFSGNTLTQVDTLQFLKCRIFDMWLGDWDRHIGQWKWGIKKSSDKVIFVPFPKDRDMAFYLFDDGWVNKAALHFIPKFQSFHDEFKDIPSLTYNGRYFDRLFLSTLQKDRFIKAAQILQSQLTDESIQMALQKLPKEIYSKWGNVLFQKLVARRKNLRQAALEYYNNVSKSPLIVGSDLPEKVIVERHDSMTRISISNGYHRKSHYSILNRNAHSIVLHTLKGADEIFIKGSSNDGPVIKLYPGRGKDIIVDQSIVKGKDKRNWVFDSKPGVVLQEKGELKDLTDNNKVLEINRKGKR